MNSNSNSNSNSNEPSFAGSAKPFDLGERTLLFARRILDICEMLPNSPECRRIRGQLCGAGTAIGANYHEGDGALTKKDKRKSFVVARKEARETRYFLKVISGKFIPRDEIEMDIRESDELVKIFSSIVDKLG